MALRVLVRRQLIWDSPLCSASGLLLALFLGLLLTQLTLLESVLLVGLGVAGVATLIEPLVGLGAALFLGLLRAYLHTEVPEVPAQIAHGFVALTLAVWLARGLKRRCVRIPHPPLLVPLALFVGAALVSLWNPVDVATYGITEVVKWVQVVLLFLFVSDYLTPRNLPWLLGALLLIGIFQAGVGIWQFGLRGEGPDHFAILNDRFYRAYGTFEQPNPYAGFLALTASLAIGLAMVLPMYQRLLAGGTALAMVVSLGMSWSRGAWMGFGAALLMMVVALPRKKFWGLLLVAALVVGGLGLTVMGLLPAPLAHRLTGFAQDVRFEDVRGVGINNVNYAVIERLAHWQAAVEMFRHNLWTGVGLGGYEPAYGDYALINWPIALGHAHNIYLNLAAETGLIGLIAYLVLWGAIFWQTWRATRRARGPLRGIAIGLLGAWTHLSVHHLLDNLYVNNVHLHVGVMLGLLAFIIRQSDRPTDLT
jgi:O-antigen ligase